MYIHLQNVNCTMWKQLAIDVGIVRLFVDAYHEDDI